MEHAPAACRDLLKDVPVAKRETYHTLRGYVREWTLAQRRYDDLAHDTSAPMDIGHVKDKQERQGQGERKRQDRPR